jgi:predicted Zn-dependent peptidase
MRHTSEITSAVLSNGLPMVEIPIQNRPETAIAIVFPGGARHEATNEIGVAHFLEHMVFKGTKRHRTARELNRSAELLGAEINGWTSDDYVMLTGLVQAESATPTTDLLADIAAEALLEEEHLETEREVILQEIADDNEDPDTAADHCLIAALFPGHRLAKPTVGDASDVAALTHSQLLSFRERQWSPAGGLFVVAGNLENLDRGRLHDALSEIPARAAPPPPPPIVRFARRVEVQERESDVAHLRLAYALKELDLGSPRDRAIGEVYCDIVGGLPASRLDDELREQRGLCYAIDCYWWGWKDRVLLTVECSLRSSNVREAYERIDATIADLSTNGPTEEECIRACAHALSASSIRLEESTARVDRAVYLILQCGDQDIEPTRHLQALESVSYEQVRMFAERVASGPCVGCVGAVATDTFD